MSGLTAAAIEAAFVAACHAELRALKPGNVHDHAPGHRMTVADFEASAAAAAPAIARAGTPVGRRVLEGVLATRDAVGTNTNLGILLLAAPLAVAAEAIGGGAVSAATLRDRLTEVLAGTTNDDAADVFEAIRLASPGGLGSAPDHDVRTAPTLSLTAAMALAADRDRIARQYVTSFADVFVLGLAAHRRAMLTQSAPSAATTAVFFTFAAGFPDTHVVRKHGLARAEAVRLEFEKHWKDKGLDDQAALLAFDAGLKAQAVNPGTSADLTVAVEFVVQLIKSK